MLGLRPKPECMPPDLALERLQARWKCRWHDCPYQQSFKQAGELFAHFTAVHVDSHFPQPTQCQIRGCTYIAHSPANMLLHLRTHVLPSAPLNREKQVASVHAADAQDKTTAIFYHTRVMPQQVDGAAAGVGFIACLVLRNISRAVAGAAAQYRQARAAAAQEDVQTFSFTPARSANSEPGEEGPEVELSTLQVFSAVSGLVAVEKPLIGLAASNSALAAYLTELLQNLASAKAALA